MKIKPTKICSRKGCNNEFKIHKSTDKFCCPECAYVAKRANERHNRKETSTKPKSKTCLHCNKEFNPYNSLQKFCSFTCSSENERSKRSRNWTEEQRSKRKANKNPNFKSGLYIRDKKKDKTGERLFAKNKRQLKKNIVERDGFLHCEACGKTYALKFETHHLIFRSEKPHHENLHDINNLFYLCINCHNDFHTDKSKRNHIVKERNLQLLFGNDILNK